ncbi:MAG: putative baseplate assembly protein, partial [Halieaceae bacterium]|nr:putative baseplate assembly protein [Halieaceae bacterium]
APAKAASVHLAFVAEPNNAPEDVLEYEAGLQVRSIPRDEELPQVFETIEPLTAYAGWNAMKPRMSYPQILDSESDTIRLRAGGPPIGPGDPVLLYQGKEPVSYGSGNDAGFLRRVNRVTELEAGEKLVLLSAEPTGAPPYFFRAYEPKLVWNAGESISSETLGTAVTGFSWPVTAISTATSFNLISYATLSSAITALSHDPEAPVLPAKMKTRAACFGHNAITEPSPAVDDLVAWFPADGSADSPSAVTDTASHVGDAAAPSERAYIYLDREYSEIVEGEYVLLRDALREGTSIVHGVELMSVEAYGLSAKVTRLEVNSTLVKPEGGSESTSSFMTRTTTVYAAPEQLDLAVLPITDDVGAESGELGADSLELGGAYISLFPGKTVAISGERADLAGVRASEILTIADNVLNDGFSVLTFTSQPAHRYLRGSVTLNGNVASATHGETVEEILGDGDAARPFASYRLKSSPLTHVSAKTESGMAPALEVRINGVLWDRVDDFRDAGPEDRVYILRIAEDGTASITFGDGERGLRPPTGQDNVTAVYRKGAGSKGMLEAGQLSLLASKPVGLKSVSNPLPPAAAADAETLEDARRNAPLRVLTLGRVVSLRDYEDYARAFAGIAKARADWTFDGAARPIFVTVAGEGGVQLPEGGEDIANLLAALQAAGEADLTVSVRNFKPASFVVEARLFIDPAYGSEDVLEAGRDALEAAFSFDARELGQGVSRAQVIAVLQDVKGVIGVDVNWFHRTGAEQTLEDRLGSARPQPSLDGTVPAAAELLTIDIASTKLEAVE